MHLTRSACHVEPLRGTSVAARLARFGYLSAGLLAAIGGCGAPAFDARFEPGGDNTVFGTVVDDRGAFQFIRDPATGNLVRVNATGGQITLPTNGQDFGVARDTGGQLTLSPSGAEEVIIAVRDDPDAMDLDLGVSRESLGDLAAVVRAGASADEGCTANEMFLDASCVPVNRVVVSDLAASIVADRESRGDTSLTEAAVQALLIRYLKLPVDCCRAWQEFRDNGGSACPDN